VDWAPGGGKKTRPDGGGGAGQGARAPGRAVEVWAFDEHRLGPKPICRRVWARAGQRPIAASHHEYQRLYLYAFVRAASGQVDWWLATCVDLALFQALIEAFARATSAGITKPGTTKSVILVLDNAGWHVSKKLKRPDGLQLCFLPPYSAELQPAELQPAERLWPLADEALANKPFESLHRLAETLERRCATLTDQPNLLKANTRVHWWPDE
jgi:hypothetical protein